MKRHNDDKWLDEALVKAIGAKKPPADFDRWKQDHPDAIDMLASQSAPRVSTRRPHDIRRIVMARPIMKLAVAAAVIIAVSLGIHFFTGQGPSVTCCAWAEIADRVEQIQAYICRTHITQSGGPLPEGTQDMEMETYASSEYGFRIDTFTDGNLSMRMYMKPEEKLMVTVVPQAKQYMRMLMDDEQLDDWRRQSQDPRYMVTGFVSDEYAELGKDTIGGIEVKGIEMVNPQAFQGVYDSFVGRLWVDVETELPVRMETEAEIVVGEEQIQQTMVMDGFEWHVDLGPEVFEPNIPDDYKLIEVKIPAQDEGSAVEALRLFAEISGGKYPTKLDMMTIMTESMQALMETMAIDPNSEPAEEQAQELASKVMPLYGSFMFYSKLLQEGKDPVYYGDVVTPDDGDAVLLRWKVSDSEYRVIWGDLTTENIPAEELAEMEAVPTE